MSDYKRSEFTNNQLHDLLTAVSTHDGFCATRKLKLQDAINREVLRNQLADFLDILDQAMASANSEQSLEAFYNTNWSISFGQHTITIENGATIYNGIYDAIKDFLTNEL